MSKLIFSVIIPTFHRNDLLVACLDCLAPGMQSLPSEKYEVIVTDDGFNTTAEEVIQTSYPWVKWLAGPKKGPGANRNHGAKYAQGKWLVFTDDDCLPHIDWLNSYSLVIDKNPSSLALEGAICPLGSLDFDLAECPINLKGGGFWSANIAVEKKLFELVGGFDENFSFSYEDIDLGIRLSSKTNIVFVPEAKVSHYVRVCSLKQVIKRIPSRSKAYAYLSFKHKETSPYYQNILTWIVLNYKLSLGKLLGSIKTKHPKKITVELINVLLINLVYIFLWFKLAKGKNIIK